MLQDIEGSRAEVFVILHGWVREVSRVYKAGIRLERLRTNRWAFITPHQEHRTRSKVGYAAWEVL